MIFSFIYTRDLGESKSLISRSLHETGIALSFKFYIVVELTQFVSNSNANRLLIFIKNKKYFLVQFFVENPNMKQKIHFRIICVLTKYMKQEIQLKEKQIKQMERKYQQELFKYRADIEMIKKILMIKKIRFYHETIVKSLEENCSLNHQHKEEEKEVNQSYTLLSSFDLFRSSKLLKTFNGHTNIVWNIDYSTFDDEPFICSEYEILITINKLHHSMNIHLVCIV
ncbi:hypothetical protein RFI_15009 [Reticulomyxa filosa]|uniref:Uncharacterized protein n=1 Tax=Reticulomyxa filosa TaxID=46433 RepID=X6N7C5_RETFI|nr:hypothetical protein RFI_15009 [Reticulomyxa filosa]|eukprot:ETO22190.1 hypothetical protein RFI_15009 [Reticulomyxa filosa]